MNLKHIVGSFFAAAVLLGTSVIASEKGEWVPDFSADIKYASRYMSKGKICTPESMTFYDFSLSLKGFYVGIWIANDQNDFNRDDNRSDDEEGSPHMGGVQYEPEEIDYYIGYGYTFEELPVVNSLSLGAAYTYFDYPSRLGWNTSQKHEANVTANLGVFLNPGVKICWDPRFEIWYGNVNVSYDYNFKDQGCDKLTAKTGLELWFGNNRYVNNEDHDNDLAATTLCWTVALDYAITENITFGPFGTLAWAIDPGVRHDWKDEGSPNCADGLNTVWGVHLNFAF